MTIQQRLRKQNSSDCGVGDLMEEAADEIERLRSSLSYINKLIGGERDIVLEAKRISLEALNHEHKETSMTKREKLKLRFDLAKVIHTSGIVGDAKTNWENCNSDAKAMALEAAVDVIKFLKESEIL